MSDTLCSAEYTHTQLTIMQQNKITLFFGQKITIYSTPFSVVFFCDNFTHFFPRRVVVNLPSEARQIESTSLGKK